MCMTIGAVLAMGGFHGTALAAKACDDPATSVETQVIFLAGDNDCAKTVTLTAEPDASGVATWVTSGDEPADFMVLKPVLADAAALASLGVANSEEDADHGWLGVSLDAVSPALAAQLGLVGESSADGEPARSNGVTVLNVVKDSPAAKAGLQRYDVIVSMDGEAIGDSVGVVAEKIAATAPGTQVKFSVLRGGQPQDLQITLGSRAEQGQVEWEYEWADVPSVNEQFRTHGRVMLKGPDGKMQTFDLGDLKDLHGLPDNIREMLPSLNDITTRVWMDKDQNELKMHVSTRVDDDGNVIEIEQKDGGAITVRRTTKDDQGQEETTEQTYDDADALKAGDEEAYDIFSRIQGPHALGLGMDLGATGGPWAFQFKLDDLKKGAHWKAEIEKSVQDATRAYEEALKSMGQFKQTQPFDPGHAFFMRSLGQPQQTFSVGSDGKIEVKMRKGDSEVIMNYENEQDLQNRNPEMYEKYQDVMATPEEEETGD